MSEEQAKIWARAYISAQSREEKALFLKQLVKETEKSGDESPKTSPDASLKSPSSDR